MKPTEIIETPDGSQGPPEVRYRAHVAFSTAYEMLQNLKQVHNRRKALIYVSNGYDFDPFSKSRAKESNERYSAMTGNNCSDSSSCDTSNSSSDTNPFSKGGNEFAAADLAAELSELTREANRANTTIYTIDPRGLVGGPDLDETKLDMIDWQDHIRETQSSLRVIADLTGGYAVVNRTISTRHSSGSTPKRATTTSWVTTPVIRIRLRSGGTSRSRSRRKASTT